MVSGRGGSREPETRPSRGVDRLVGFVVLLYLGINCIPWGGVRQGRGFGGLLFKKTTTTGFLGEAPLLLFYSLTLFCLGGEKMAENQGFSGFSGYLG